MKLPLSKCFVIYIAQKLSYFTLTMCLLVTNNGILAFVSTVQ